MDDKLARELIAKEEARRKVRAMRRRKCEECGENLADLPSLICVGCQAYREHTGHY